MYDYVIKNIFTKLNNYSIIFLRLLEGAVVKVGNGVVGVGGIT